MTILCFTSKFLLLFFFFFFFFNDTATTEIYTLSLHDALPISHQTGSAKRPKSVWIVRRPKSQRRRRVAQFRRTDRKSTRLNSSHLGISYAVFCLKKKKKEEHKISPVWIHRHQRGLGGEG